MDPPSPYSEYSEMQMTEERHQMLLIAIEGRNLKKCKPRKIKVTCFLVAAAGGAG
jgi:hypothetical protein